MWETPIFVSMAINKLFLSRKHFVFEMLMYLQSLLKLLDIAIYYFSSILLFYSGLTLINLQFAIKNAHYFTTEIFYFLLLYFWLWTFFK